MGALEYEWSRGEHEKDTLSFRFRPCARKPKSWKEEIYEAARAIANRTEKPIWVCASGGIASEVACRAFVDQGIHISVLTVAHEGGTNAFDIQRIIQWCHERGVQHKIVRMDMHTFFGEEIERYAEQYVAINPFRYFQIRLMELVEGMGGFAVLAVDEHIFHCDTEKQALAPDDLYYLFSVGNIAPLRWCEDNKVSHEPYFYFSTSEICLAYLQHPLISFAMRNPEALFHHPSNTYTLRRIVYQSVWTDLHVRVKSNGLEHIGPLVNDVVSRLQQKFGTEQHVFHLPVSIAEEQLREGIAPLYSVTT